MAKSFKDPGFAKEFRKLTGVESSPITAEAIEAAIKDLPHDPETIALYKHLADPRPMRRAEASQIFLRSILRGRKRQQAR